FASILLVKNVCCLELNQDALHIWFVYSLFSFQRSTLPRSNFYIITNFRLNVKNFFKKSFFKLFCSVVVVCCDNFYILSSRLLFVNNFFVVFSNFFREI
ncbi:hypothetical protein CUM54_04370, partial [Enterococcus faecalis]